MSVFLAAVAIAACVGDDPSSATSSSTDASTDDSPTSSDASGDASTAADSGSDAAAFTPAALPGLVLWLDDESIDTAGFSDVSEWQDKSGKSNNAFPATDGGPNAAPTILTAGTGIGSKQAVHFNGATNFLQIADSSSLRWSSDFTLATVERQAAFDASAAMIGYVYGKFTTATTFPGPALYVAIQDPPYFAQLFGMVDGNDFVANAADAAVPAEVPHLVIFQWIADGSGTSGTLRIQLDQSTSTKRLAAFPDISATGFDAFIGANGNGDSLYFAGDLATLIAVNGPTSDADIAALGTYLKARYGL